MSSVFTGYICNPVIDHACKILEECIGYPFCFLLFLDLWRFWRYEYSQWLLW